MGQSQSLNIQMFTHSPSWLLVSPEEVVDYAFLLLALTIYIPEMYNYIIQDRF